MIESRLVVAWERKIVDGWMNGWMDGWMDDKRPQGKETFEDREFVHFLTVVIVSKVCVCVCVNKDLHIA